MASLLNEKQRVLIVTVKSAELKMKPKHNNGKTYTCVYMNPEARLFTKKTIIPNSIWDDRFAFSISDISFTHQGSSSVCFEVHRARRSLLGFGDSLIGTAKCDVKSVLSNNGFDEDDDYEEYYSATEFEDPRYPNMFASCDDDDVDNGKKKEAYYRDIYCYDGKGRRKRVKKASACLRIVKGWEKKGVLKVELEVGETISCLANEIQWKKLTMPYDEFTMLESPNRKNKFRSWTCFVSESA